MKENERTSKEKKLCYILRHHPEEFDVILDEDGFAEIEDISNILQVSKEDVLEIVEKSSKGRFETVDKRIRALYGHSFPLKVKKKEIKPPDVLYHGTTHKAYEKIKTEGLKPMSRQYVHLSMDIQTAVTVGKRRDNNPVILKIDASKAYSDGYKFYEGNNITVLADDIPQEYIESVNQIKYKGIFWIIDTNELENNNPYFFFIETDENGTIIRYDRELTSKNEDNYNHKLTWNSLPKSLTHNKEFDYYPRGRVEIRNGKHKLFLNPILMNKRVLDYIEKQFKSTDDVTVIADNSEHYQCKA